MFKLSGEFWHYNLKHERYSIENGVILAYEVMEKELHKGITESNYDRRKFVPEKGIL